MVPIQFFLLLLPDYINTINDYTNTHKYIDWISKKTKQKQTEFFFQSSSLNVNINKTKNEIILNEFDLHMFTSERKKNQTNSNVMIMNVIFFHNS